MKMMRGFRLRLGGRVAAGCVAAAGCLAAAGCVAATATVTTAAVTTAAVSTPVAPAPSGLVPRSADLTVGNPEGKAPVPSAGRAVNTSHPDQVVGKGTPASCTSAAVVNAVAHGGITTFNCGANPVTITMTATAKVVNTSREIVLDGGGKITLSGGGKIRILYMNTCDPRQELVTNGCWEQQWPRLVVQNLTFRNAYSALPQTSASSYGGGAIFDEGGQLTVVNSAFIDNRCYPNGPDLGGAAIRAYGMYLGTPVYITDDTFTGNTCSNGAARSGLYANFDVIDSLMSDNQAIGFGANPAAYGTRGGGSGGAIYTDGDGYSLTVNGTVIRGNTAREGGGGIFFVVNARGGSLTIQNSTMVNNPSGRFQDAPGIFDSVNGHDTRPVVIQSSVS